MASDGVPALYKHTGKLEHVFVEVPFCQGPDVSWYENMLFLLHHACENTLRPVKFRRQGEFEAEYDPDLLQNGFAQFAIIWINAHTMRRMSTVAILELECFEALQICWENPTHLEELEL